VRVDLGNFMERVRKCSYRQAQCVKAGAPVWGRCRGMSKKRHIGARQVRYLRIVAVYARKLGGLPNMFEILRRDSICNA
jgi:hypothetical protein